MTFFERAADIPWQTWLVFGQMAAVLVVWVCRGRNIICHDTQKLDRSTFVRPGLETDMARLTGRIPLPLCSCSVIRRFRPRLENMGRRAVQRPRFCFRHLRQASTVSP